MYVCTCVYIYIHMYVHIYIYNMYLFIFVHSFVSLFIKLLFIRVCWCIYLDSIYLSMQQKVVQ